MDIFINSTFAQSMRGYRLMRMCDNGFLDISSVNEVPAQIYNFFNEDLFKAIWCEISDEKELFSPMPTGSFFGIKGFCDVFNNKKNGIVNIAFYADADEIFMLADIVNKILCNYNDFSDLIFRSFHIDSAGDYSVDKHEFLHELESLKSGDFPKFTVNTRFAYHTARDFLHFAVCMGSRERALTQLPGKRFRCPKCMIDEKEFDIYINEVK